MLFQKRKAESASPFAQTLPLPEPAPPSIGDMVAQFDYHERMCNDAIQRQEDISRRFRYAGTSSASPDVVLQGVNDDPDATASGAIIPRNKLKLSDIAFGDFRDMADMAARVVPGGFPISTKRFILNVCSAEFEDIEVIETEIRLLKSQMADLERKIMNATPDNIIEATRKLKFMVAMMLDGTEIEQDYFAYLVEECADIIDEKLCALSLTVNA